MEDTWTYRQRQQNRKGEMWIFELGSWRLPDSGIEIKLADSKYMLLTPWKNPRVYGLLKTAKAEAEKEYNIEKGIEDENR